MGYTHYWYRPSVLDPETFKAWTYDVSTILNNLPKNSRSAGGHHANDPLVIRGAWAGLDGGDDLNPKIEETVVSFNGDDTNDQNLGHESFFIPQTLEPKDYQERPDGWIFEFCKTARKPYDLAVTACLIRLAYHFPEGVKISSDGDVEEWEEGRQLCQELFGFAVVPFRDYAEAE